MISLFQWDHWDQIRVGSLVMLKLYVKTTDNPSSSGKEFPTCILQYLSEDILGDLLSVLDGFAPPFDALLACTAQKPQTFLNLFYHFSVPRHILDRKEGLSRGGHVRPTCSNEESVAVSHCFLARTEEKGRLWAYGSFGDDHLRYLLTAEIGLPLLGHFARNYLCV